MDKGLYRDHRRVANFQTIPIPNYAVHPIYDVCEYREGKYTCSGRLCPYRVHARAGALTCLL